MPSCPSTNCLEMNNPIPVPTVERVVKNASKTLGMISGAMPMPSSVTVRRTPSDGESTSLTEMERVPAADIA